MSVEHMVANQMPWSAPVLEGWSIVGMNHYWAEGERMLYVVMIKDGHCIKQEGRDNIHLWRRMAALAKAYDEVNARERPSGQGEYVG